MGIISFELWQHKVMAKVDYNLTHLGYGKAICFKTNKLIGVIRAVFFAYLS